MSGKGNFHGNFMQQVVVEQTTIDVRQTLTSSVYKAKWAILNIELTDARIGGSGLTTTNGMKVPEGSYTTLEWVDLNKVYIINDGGVVKVKYSVILMEDL